MIFRLSSDLFHDRRPLAVAVWLGVAVVGCGGETSKDPACGGVEACGGDLTGNWKVTLECAIVEPSSPLLNGGPRFPMPARE